MLKTRNDFEYDLKMTEQAVSVAVAWLHGGKSFQGSSAHLVKLCSEQGTGRRFSMRRDVERGTANTLPSKHAPPMGPATIPTARSSKKAIFPLTRWHRFVIHFPSRFVRARRPNTSV